MKKQENNNSWLIDMLNAKGLKISEAEGEFRRSIEQFSEKHRQFGFRTEAMFAYVVGAMGQCRLIKQEDCGHWFVDEDKYLIPDYRLFLKSGESFLIEVKNETKKQISFKNDYLSKLKSYSELNNVPLRIAIYWQMIGVWSLNAPEDFENGDKKASISIDVAIAKSQIAALGDMMIATKPPLSIRMICAPNKTTELDANGQCQICFSDIEHYCDGSLITDAIEKRIAFQLILSSQWNEEEHLEIVGNKVSWIEYTYTPEQYDSENGFASVGFLSSIISTEYKSATSNDEGIHSISPKSDPEDFEIFIPEHYKGKTLPLWLFHMQPNEEYKSCLK